MVLRKQFHIPHFVEAGRTNPKTVRDRMPEHAYATALDHLVITCVDLAFLHGDCILLARRNTYPRKSWWIIGGRMIAGESPIQTAQRKAAEEAQLPDLAGDRFQFIRAYSTCFTRREQAPMENGSHTVNLTYQVILTDEERQQIQLSHREYEADYGWVPLTQVRDLVASEDELDQALLQIVHDVQQMAPGTTASAHP
jgi:ADP-ribose pyrophosphatase YjhB (NUDIX family)